MRPFTADHAKDGLAIDNAVGYQNDRFLNCAFLKFQKAGSPFLAAAVNEFLRSYDAGRWAYNGPELLDRVASEHRERICPDLENPADDESPIVESPESSTVVTNDTTSKSCWMQPLPSTAIQPVLYWHWTDYCFTPGQSPVGANASSIVSAPGLYAVHLNNHIHGEELEEQSYVPGSLCDIVLHKFCIICNDTTAASN